MSTLAMKTTTFLICCLSITSAANILAILPIASLSHHFWNSRLLVSLAEKGHNLTVISPMGQKKPIANFTDIVIRGLYLEQAEVFDFELMTKIPNFVLAPFFYYMASISCIKIQQSDAWTQLMNYPQETKFDLVIVEAMGAECLLGILPRFGNPPIVSIAAFNVPYWVFGETGTPSSPSYIPMFLLPATDQMTFLQRMENFLYTVLANFLHNYCYIPYMNKIARDYYGPNTPSVYEIKENIAVQMANFHPVLDFPFPTSPNFISAAGLHITDPQPLPQDLKRYLDDAKEGVVLFSLGTNVRSKDLKIEKRKEIIDAFAELPIKVLWKFEDDTLPGLPKNVKIEKWLPQSDILAHPNVKAFITHSGLLSIHEAIYRGVPIIGIPFVFDQPSNIIKVMERGAAIRLDYKDLTKENLVKAVKTILNDNSYRENMKILSARFKDTPQTSLERAMFWTEYVLRHNGAPHLRSAAKDLNFIQYFLLDVIAFLLAIPSFSILILYCVCRKKKSEEKGKQKQN